jgi:hypothetical protein
MAKGSLMADWFDGICPLAGTPLAGGERGWLDFHLQGGFD